MPLLVVWLGYEGREATGTSLAAIVLIGVFGALAHGAYGNVHWAKGLLIGVPAVVGSWPAPRYSSVFPSAPCRSGSRCSSWCRPGR